MERSRDCKTLHSQRPTQSAPTPDKNDPVPRAHNQLRSAKDWHRKARLHQPYPHSLFRTALQAISRGQFPTQNKEHAVPSEVMTEVSQWSQIQYTYRLRAVAKTGLDKSASNSCQHGGLAPNQLPKGSETADAISNSNASYGFSHNPRRKVQLSDLGALREKEKICIQAMTQSIEQLKTARESHQALCQQYETLKIELKVTAQVLDQATRHQKITAPPTSLGSVAVDFTDSMHDVFQHRGNFEFFRAKKGEKLQLEKRIGEQVEVKSSLKTCIAAKKIELQQLHNEIKERMKKNTVSARVVLKIGTLLTEFKDVNPTTPSPPSPVDSFPESFPSEISQLDDDDVDSGDGGDDGDDNAGVDSTVADCTV
ncbi:hypothetical protein G7Y89_g14248 [Cudoniella acicularis]|uniref:Uncharacterized protein n=1 Tax=Cudoniella acicularis TaxID=354080 RepID=A0A8H4R600_9HELO|nr:hypothetical protein G7Y89_g14248 [Cudoniella acicularis]